MKLFQFGEGGWVVREKIKLLFHTLLQVGVHLPSALGGVGEEARRSIRCQMLNLIKLTEKVVNDDSLKGVTLLP